jgi:hypothetical protein
VSAILLITGISAVHRLQKPWAKGIAAAGYYTCVASLVVFAVVFSSFWVLGWLGFHAGVVLFGAGVVQAGILHKPAGWLLAAGTPIAFGIGIAADRLIDARGGPSVFAGSGVALIGFMWLALSEAQRNLPTSH